MAGSGVGHVPDPDGARGVSGGRPDVVIPGGDDAAPVEDEHGAAGTVG